MKDQHVIIIGAGITGLSAAWYLEKRGFTNITILEGGNRIGGKINTLNENGFMVEEGPDSFVVTKPYALDLVKDLGMEADLIFPNTNAFSILKDGKLESPPKGLNMMVPTDMEAFRESSFFTEAAKERILEERNIAANTSDEDESFSDFMLRRFGKDMLDLYAGPLFTGIYATPADELSLNATFPMLKKMEQNYGSITAAIEKQMAAAPAPNPGSSRSTFMGLKDGIRSLADALVNKLKYTDIRINSFVEKLSETGDNYILQTANDAQFTAGNVIITLPAAQAKHLLFELVPEASEVLSKFSISSSRIVTLAYKKEAVSGDLDATGYVSAANEKNFVNAGSWISSKWDGRAKDGYILLRCFIGKSKEALSFTDQQLVDAAHREMSWLLGISEEPAAYWVARWDDALPQYKVGHMELVNALLESVKPFKGLQVTGSYLYGVGMPDCIKQGMDAANFVGQ